MRVFILIIIAVAFCGWWEKSFAQYQLDLQHLTVDEGLTQNVVMDLLEDNRGYLWVGTRDGLNRYDGANVVQYVFNPADSTSLSNNSITRLYQDSRGRIWIGTERGLNLYHTDTENFTRIPSATNEFLTIKDIRENPGGQLNILSSDGLYQFDPDADNLRFIQSTRFLNEGDNLLFFSGDSVIVTDEDKNLYTLPSSPSEEPLMVTNQITNSNHILTVEQINDYEFIIANDKDLYHYNLRDNELLNRFRVDSSITAIHIDENVVWAGSDGMNVYKIDLSGENAPQLVTSEFVNINMVSTPRSIERTNDGVIWIGLNGFGIARLVPRDDQFGLIQVDINKKNALINRSIRSILPISDSLVVIGGYTGLEQFNLADGSRKTLYIRPGEPSSDHTPVFDFVPYSLLRHPTKNSHLFIGTEGGGLSLFNTKTLELKRFYIGDGSFEANLITSILHKGDDLYLGTLKGIYLFSLKREKVSVLPLQNNHDIHVKTLIHYDEHSIWAGLNRGGMVRINTRDKKIEQLNFLESNELPASPVLSLHKTDSSSVWVGTQSGLHLTDSTGFVLESYSVNDGLPNGTIYGIHQGTEGNLWMSTNKGLSNFQPATQTFTNYNLQDGLQSLEFNTNAHADWNNEILFFGGVEGLNYFRPSEIRQNTSFYKVYVEHLRSAGSTYMTDITGESDQKYSFSYTDREIRIALTTPVFRNLNNTAFYYRIPSLSPKWKKIETQNVLILQNLVGGSYEVEIVRATESTIEQAAVTSLLIEIVPALIDRTEVRFAILISIFLLAAGGITYKVRQLENEKEKAHLFAQRLLSVQEEERKRISNALHDSIGNYLMLTKMNLGKLQRSKTEETREAEIEHTLYILNESIEEVRSISHNLHPHLLEKIGISKTVEALIRSLENADRLSISSTVENVDTLLQEEQSLILYRFIQETLTNVIKHANADHCSISLRKEGSSVIYEISDNGRGFRVEKVDSEVSLGLRSLRERAEMLGGKLAFNSEPGKGTLITLTIH